MKQLVLGGVRSGKSYIAEQLALATKLPVVYIATAQAKDTEMQSRIIAHQRRRPNNWVTCEEPLALANCLHDYKNASQCLLIDCLTLWITNLLLNEDSGRLQREVDALLSILPQMSCNVIMVSNETGMGVVPLGELTRRYCDEAGILHQRLAQACDRVILSVAGLPVTLKGEKYDA